MKTKMKNELATFYFLITLAQMFLLGIHYFTRMSGKATCISVIIGAMMSYLVLHLLNLQKEKYKLIYLPFLFIQLIYTLQEMIGFITLNVVSDLNFYLVFITILLLSCFSYKKGTDTLTRAGFLIFLAVVFLFFISFVFLFPAMDFPSLLPIMDSSYKNIIISTLAYFTMSTTPYFYLSLIDVEDWEKEKKTLRRGNIFTHLFILFLTLMILSILGISLTNIYAYPELAIFKKISFLNIIDRMESVFSLSYFLLLFFYFSLNFHIFLNTLSEKLPGAKKKKEDILLLVCTLSLVFTIGIQIHVNFFLSTSLILFLLSLIANKIRRSK